MPWDSALPNLGFTTGTPWLPLGPTHAGLAVSEQEQDHDAPLHYTRRLTAFRKASAALRVGHLNLLDAEGQVLAFVREADGEKLLCVFNLSREPVEWANHLVTHAQMLEVSSGTSRIAGDRLQLGPLAACFLRR
jgi:alpha-glucosidase